jgi:hypothetical protein
MEDTKIEVKTSNTAKNVRVVVPVDSSGMKYVFKTLICSTSSGP